MIQCTSCGNQIAEHFTGCPICGRLNAQRPPEEVLRREEAARTGSHATGDCLGMFGLFVLSVVLWGWAHREVLSDNLSGQASVAAGILVAVIIATIWLFTNLSRRAGLMGLFAAVAVGWLGRGSAVRLDLGMLQLFFLVAGSVAGLWLYLRWSSLAQAPRTYRWLGRTGGLGLVGLLLLWGISMALYYFYPPRPPLASLSPQELTAQANAGDAKAASRLGYMYIKGEGGMPKDDALASHWTRKAAELGDAKAQFNLGWSYLHGGMGLPKDVAVAAVWMEKAAHQGNANAQYQMALACGLGKGVEWNSIKAADFCRQAAEAGLAEAQSLMGTMYAKGWGVKPDAKQAIDWWKRAAAHNDMEAEYNLGLAYEKGTCYEAGSGVAQDDAEAIMWYRKAAEKGLAMAMHNLFAILTKHPDREQAKGEGLMWLRKAAEAGFPQAQYQLGLRFYEGDGVAKDPQEAFRWLLKAANQNVPEAQHDVGICYRDGIGTTPDARLAAHWFERAERKGLNVTKQGPATRPTSRPKKGVISHFGNASHTVLPFTSSPAPSKFVADH